VPRPLVLVGSSMGGHVSAAAAARVKSPRPVLLAPAFYMPGFEAYTPQDIDPVRPPSCTAGTTTSCRSRTAFAGRASTRLTLHVLNSDHRLEDQIEAICTLLREFLGHRLGLSDGASEARHGVLRRAGGGDAGAARRRLRRPVLADGRHLRLRELAQALAELLAAAPPMASKPAPIDGVVGGHVALARGRFQERQHVLEVGVAQVAIAIGQIAAHRLAHVSSSPRGWPRRICARSATAPDPCPEPIAVPTATACPMLRKICTVDSVDRVARSSLSNMASRFGVRAR
jgi:hypothetical protein